MCMCVCVCVCVSVCLEFSPRWKDKTQVTGVMPAYSRKKKWLTKRLFGYGIPCSYKWDWRFQVLKWQAEPNTHSYVATCTHRPPKSDIIGLHKQISSNPHRSTYFYLRVMAGPIKKKRKKKERAWKISRADQSDFLKFVKKQAGDD